MPASSRPMAGSDLGVHRGKSRMYQPLRRAAAATVTEALFTAHNTGDDSTDATGGDVLPPIDAGRDGGPFVRGVDCYLRTNIDMAKCTRDTRCSNKFECYTGLRIVHRG